MAEGKRAEEWIFWAHMMALTANINRDSKAKPEPYSAEDISPYANKKAIEERRRRLSEASTQDFVTSQIHSAKLRRFD